MNSQDSKDLKALLEGRGNFYRFLSRLYVVEVDEPLMAALRAIEIPETADDPRMAEGWKRLGAVLKDGLGDNPVETLAVDYARIFLSAGVTAGAAYPIESVYTSPEHLVMQDAWEAVCKAYREAGFERDKSVDVHEDQLGLELAFLAHLNDRLLAVVDKDPGLQSVENRAAFVSGLRAQKQFLEAHPLRWVHDFCRDVRKCPGSDFYPAVSLLTEGFIDMDAALVDDLIAEYGTDGAQGAAAEA